MASLFLLFSHTLTRDQHHELSTTRGIDTIFALPPELQTLWSAVPADISSEEMISKNTLPIIFFLEKESLAGDQILVQGDFGMTFAIVQWALQNKRVPLYATTERKAVEKHNSDGSVEMTHIFRHVQFREYNFVNEVQG